MAVQKHRLRAMMLYFRTTKLARGMFSFPRFHNTTLPGHLFDFKKVHAVQKHFRCNVLLSKRS